MNGYAQGLPFKQIQADCETKLSYDDKKGFGRGDLLGEFARTPTWFDPATITGSCNIGDPGRAAGKAVDGTSNTQKNYRDGRQVDWGKNTWGGKDKCDSEGCYKGLTEKESTDAKNQAIREADKAYEEWKEADDDAKANPDDKAKQKKAEEKKEEAKKKTEEAGKDPNKKEEKKAEPAKPKPSTRPVGPGESPCEQALQAAREVVGECQRTGWRSGGCQGLWAKMHGCADPERIYVDPDSGYACGSKVDPEALKQAWVDRCHQLRRPVPGGPDPCEPPSIDRWGHFVGANPNDICNNPAARIDPDSPECIATLKIQEFTPSNRSLIAWGLNKLGGPIVVLPEKNPPAPPSPPGPQPTPGPKP